MQRAYPAPGRAKAGYGSNWVIAAVIVRLPMAGRPVAVPVLAKLVIKGMTSASGCGWAAAWRRCWPGRLPAGVPTSWPAPPAPGKSWGDFRRASPGLPGCARTPLRTSYPRPVPGGGDGPAKGDELPSLARLAADAAFTPAAITRYGKTATIGAAAITCLWYGPFSIRPGRAGNTPAAGCPPTVSAPDGHGMILIERCVDIEDTTYRVISVGLDP
jgi:hypothetical protein